jgi:hypothetical protein
MFGQNKVQDKLIGKWEHIDEKGRTHKLEVTKSNWKHTRPFIFKGSTTSYSGDYKFVKAKKIVVTYDKDLEGNDLKKTIKILELDNTILIIKLIEKKWIMGKDRTIYTFKRIE